MKLRTTNLFLILSLLALASLKEEGQLFDLSKEIVYSKENGFGYDFNTKPQSENNRKPAYVPI